MNIEHFLHVVVLSGVKPNHLIRHTSCDSVDSINSQSSTGSLASQQSAVTYSDKKKLKKKNWVRPLLYEK